MKKQMNFNYLQACRLCSSKDLKHQLHLEPSPLANNFTDTPVEQEKFPLDLLECQNCGHNQLSIVVNPEIMFSNYLFVTGTSKVTRDHFENYANEMIDRFKIKDTDLVYDIGGNDGTLLQHFVKKSIKAVNVEPAANLKEIAEKNGVHTVTDFFTSQTAVKLKKQYGSAKLITCNNCYAHINDLKDVALGVRELLSHNGVFVFEVGYLIDVINKLNFDTLYHEHLSFHTVASLIPFFDNLGMTIFNVDRVTNQDGSIRVFVCKSSSDLAQNGFDRTKLSELIKLENNLGLKVPDFFLNTHLIDKNYASVWKGYQKRIDEAGRQLKTKLEEIKKAGKTVIGYGASAKSCTLLTTFGIGKDLVSAIIDENPLKIGKYNPIGIPIVAKEELYKAIKKNGDKPEYDYCLILSCNFADSIIEKVEKDWEAYHTANNLNGSGRYPTFIVPLPTLKIKRYCENKTCTCGEGPWEPLSILNAIKGYRCQSCGGIDYGMPAYNFTEYNFTDIKK